MKVTPTWEPKSCNPSYKGGRTCRAFYGGDSACKNFGGKAECLLGITGQPPRSVAPQTPLTREEIERVRENASNHSYDGVNFRKLCDMALNSIEQQKLLEETYDELWEYKEGGLQP